jgi:hypothetical protein
MIPGAQKGFLRYVFCIVRVTEKQIGQSKDWFLMGAHKGLPCRDIAVHCPAN